MKKLLIWNVALGLCLVLAVSGSVWFNNTHTGWLADKVNNPMAFQESWQARLNQLQISHPAVLHVQPEGCLCQPLSARHLKSISNTAEQNDFSLYQVNSSWKGLGEEVTLDNLPEQVMPVVMITQESGELAYLGAYSDGLRCNESTSLVDAFLASPNTLPNHTVVNLDVETCICPQ